MLLGITAWADTIASTKTSHYIVKAQEIQKNPISSLSNRPTQEELKQAVNYAMGQYDLSGDFYKVAECESNFYYYAYNPGGNSYGVFQFIPSTFLSFSKKSGMKLEYKSPKDQIKLAAWAFKHGLKYHWDCYCQLSLGDRDCARRGL